MKKRICGLFVATLMLFTLCGCSANQNGALKTLDDDHAATVRNDLEIFSDGSISEITECVFGVASDDESADDSGNGIIAELFANAEAQVTSVEDTSITYTIVSPDISDFFRANADELLVITTTEELREMLIEYAKTAPQKEYTVTLNYSISESGVDVAYDNPDFINAMTGGLIDAYADLYSQYLEGEG